MTQPENPFDRFEIDPLAGREVDLALPRSLDRNGARSRARRAPASLREELTLHPAKCLRAALLAHPERGRRTSIVR